MNADLKIISESVDTQTKIFHLHGWLDAQGEGSLITAVQEAMQYIRINDNSPYMVEELPLYEGKIM